MWELDHKEGWALKNWCFWTVVLKTLEGPLDCKEIKPVNPKGNQSWIFIGRADAEAEAPIPTWCEELTHWKRYWCWERLWAAEDEMVGWHHQLNGHEFEQTSGDSEGRKPGLLQSMGSQSQTQLRYWTTSSWKSYLQIKSHLGIRTSTYHLGREA